MKRLFSVFAIFMVTIACGVLFTACGDSDGGTYYPAQNEMQTNLESAGYTTTITTELGDKTGTSLSATKEDEYIYFYWLDDSENCEYYYNLLEEQHPDYNSLVKIENDEKFGNIVYCSTEKAVNDAGIRVVQVKV